MLRVLLIDDNPADRALVRRELERSLSLIDATEVSDQSELEAALAQDSFDLVITDYHLRWNDGLNVLRAIKSHDPDRPVIMFTGTGTQEIAVEAMKMGLDDYVIKAPQHFVRLRGAVQAALKRAEDRRRMAQMEAEREELLAREHASRLEAEAAVRMRDQFLSLASHELKTPLTSLMGYVELLQRRMARDNAVPERDRRAVQVIVEQAGRLNRLLHMMLDISRIQLGQLTIERRPVDLEALAQRVVADLSPTLTHRTIVCEGPGEKVLVDGDEPRLEQVLLNLVQNGVKYSPEGGPITVRLGRQERTATIAVIDEGIGIPHDALPRLFDRFYRAGNVDPQQVSGMGIGLYVVKEIVALHGGSIDVASVEGKGSTLTVMLPLHEEATEPPQIRANPPTPPNELGV